MAQSTNSKGKKTQNQNRKGRTDRRGSDQKRNQQNNNVVLIIVAVFVVMLVLLIAYEAINSARNDTLYQTVSASSTNPNEIEIPLTEITNEASYYQYKSNGVWVKFFAVMGSDGDVHTAFDACDVCWQEKKGYYQDGSSMVCRNCGNRYSTNQIGTANQGGGCWPGYIERTVSGGNVRIRTSELDSGRGFFR